MAVDPQYLKKTTLMTEATQLPPSPDHLSADLRSSHHAAAVFKHDIGVRLNDKVEAFYR